MKDRALRRHQEFKVKKRNIETYQNCIGDDLPETELQELENNVEKLRKVCVASRPDEDSKKAGKKPLRELKHDISMKEQLF